MNNTILALLAIVGFLLQADRLALVARILWERLRLLLLRLEMETLRLRRERILRRKEVSE